MKINPKLWQELNLIYVPAKVKIDGKHVYHREADGQLLTGTTTIGKVKDKSYLMHWTVKRMYEYLTENWDIKKKYTKVAKEKLLYSGRLAWRGVRDEAADVGTLIHKWMECHIQGTDYKKTEEYKESQKLKKELREDIKNSIKEFLQWEKDWGVNWLLSEEIVTSEKHNTAGMLDGLAWFNGEKCPTYLLGTVSLLDIKTGRHSEDHAIQTAAYKMQLEEQMGVVAKERLIIRVPRINESFDVSRIMTPYEFDIETFLHLRETHRWNTLVKNNFMEMVDGYKKFSPNIIFSAEKKTEKVVKKAVNKPKK